MEDITLFIAVISSLLVMRLTPVKGLIIYVAVLAWYPSYLTVKIGTVDFNVLRIVILAIYANLFLQVRSPTRVKFMWLDKLVIIYFLCQIFAGALTTQSFMVLLENRAGAVFDAVLPYFAVRMIITRREHYLALLEGILIIAVPLAIIGLYQCMTGNNPVGFLREYHAWGSGEGYTPSGRYGFFRADVTFPVSIMFGLFFAMFGPVCTGLMRHISSNKLIYAVGIGLMGVGVLSSMSSGPMLAGLVAVLFVAFYRYRRHWKAMLATIILICGTVEIISNRHFYDVLGGYTLVPHTAWYRSRLISVALFEGGMSGHWITGFGYAVDPGWGPKIDGRDHADVVNHYLLILCRFGLVGLVPFLAMNVAVIKKLVDAYKASTLDSDKWLVWCLSAGLFGLGGAFVSVSLFGQATTIYYMMIGFAGVMPIIVTKSERQSIIKPEPQGQRYQAQGSCVDI